MWYKVLKVDMYATEEEIENAYKTLMQNPKISIDMEQTLKIREAYKEGMRQNKGIVKQKVSTSEGNKFFANINEAFKIYRNLKLILIFAVIIVIISVVAYEYVESNYFTEPEVHIDYGNDISNCIVNNDIGEATMEDLKLALIEKSYKIEFENEESFMAIKTVDDVNVLVEVKDGFNIKCDMSLYKQLDTTYDNFPAKLVESVAFEWGDVNEFSIDVEIFIMEPVLTSNTIVNTSYSEVDDTREDFDFYLYDSSYENQEYADEISDDKYFMLIDLLKAEFELLNG